MSLIGMKVEPFVMPMPRHAYFVGLLQDKEGDAGSPETGSDSQPRGASANDDRIYFGARRHFGG
jgi:hypothetical protein